MQIRSKRALGILLTAIGLMIGLVKPVQAADLVVNCPDSSSYATEDTTATCVFENSGSSTSNSPLFDVNNLAPGQSRVQVLTINNLDQDESCQLQLSVTDQTTASNLASVLDTSIYTSSTVWFEQTLQDLFDQTSLDLGVIEPLDGESYTWELSLNGAKVGNEFQGQTTNFDFSVSFTCGDPSLTPTVTPSPIPTEDDTGTLSTADTDSTDSTETTTEPAPTCDVPDQFESTPTGLSAVAGANSVTLSWDSYPNVSQYVIFFYNQAGEEFSVLGSAIGTDTSYTISNLTAGTWSFELIATGGEDNLCTSPRTGTTVEVTGGAVAAGGPVGEEEGDILGVETEEEEVSEQIAAEPEVETEGGQVAGAQTSCPVWQNRILWVLLFVQFLGLLTVEIVKRKDQSAIKYVWHLGITLLSIIAFYIFSDCNCYGDQSLAAILCRWYWLVSMIETGLMRMIGYGFIEVAESDQE